MKRNLFSIAVAIACSSIPVSKGFAADFTNGGFELGNTSGWTTYGGTWSGSPVAPIDPSVYMPGGANYNASATPQISVVTSGTDSNANGSNTVFDGTYAVRVNNANNDQSVSVLTQTVTGYSGTSINFAWSAVLQGSHGVADSDHFVIRVYDNTSAREIALISYSSATAPAGVFTNNGQQIYYSGWRAESIRTTPGHDYTITLLVADCPYGGHWGYVYLDSFGVNPLTGIPINIFVSGPSPDDTQVSMGKSASSLRSVFNLQSGLVTSGLSYDCNVFDSKGLCVSGGGRYTNANGAANSSGALLIGSYRVNENLRIGGYLDEDLHNRTPNGISLSNNSPLGGVFAVWQQNANSDGWGGSPGLWS